jgi:hypothetical protein
MGDAAHSVLPPTGEGLNSGLEDCVYMMKAVAEAPDKVCCVYLCAYVYICVCSVLPPTRQGMNSGLEDCVYIVKAVAEALDKVCCVYLCVYVCVCVCVVCCHLLERA